MAELTSLRGHDHQLAKSMFVEAANGEPIAMVSTRYAEFLLDQEPESLEIAEDLLDAVLAQAPHFSRAIAARSFTLLALGRDPVHVRRAIEAELTIAPRDQLLLAVRVYLNLCDSNFEGAESDIRKLRKSNPSADFVIHYEGLFALFSGKLPDVVLSQMGRSSNADGKLNIAIVQWAWGAQSEARDQVQTLPDEELRIAALIEKRVIVSLCAGTEVGATARALETEFGGARLRAFDPITFHFLARHPSTPPEVSAILDELVRQITCARSGE